MNGFLANTIPPWGLLRSPVTLTVLDPDQTPYCVTSPAQDLADILEKEWPHEDILHSLPA
jgi:hypothetical protein